MNDEGYGERNFLVAVDMLWQAMFVAAKDVENWEHKVPPKLMVLEKVIIETPSVEDVLIRLVDAYSKVHESFPLACRRWTAPPSKLSSDSVPRRPIRPKTWSQVGFMHGGSAMVKQCSHLLIDLNPACLSAAINIGKVLLETGGWQTTSHLDQCLAALEVDSTKERAKYSEEDFTLALNQVKQLRNKLAGLQERLEAMASGKGSSEDLGMECTVCLEDAIDPCIVQTCHHTFCRRCLMALLERCHVPGQEGTCPLCRTVWTEENFSMRPLQSVVLVKYLTSRLTDVLTVSKDKKCNFDDSLIARWWCNLGIALCPMGTTNRSDLDGFVYPIDSPASAAICGKSFNAIDCFKMCLEKDQGDPLYWSGLARALLFCQRSHTVSLSSSGEERKVGLLDAIGEALVREPDSGYTAILATRALQGVETDTKCIMLPKSILVPSESGKWVESNSFTMKDAIATAFRYGASHKVSEKVKVDHWVCLVTYLAAPGSPKTLSHKLLGLEEEGNRSGKGPSHVDLLTVFDHVRLSTQEKSADSRSLCQLACASYALTQRETLELAKDNASSNIYWGHAVDRCEVPGHYDMIADMMEKCVPLCRLKEGVLAVCPKTKKKRSIAEVRALVQDPLKQVMTSQDSLHLEFMTQLLEGKANPLDPTFEAKKESLKASFQKLGGVSKDALKELDQEVSTSPFNAPSSEEIPKSWVRFAGSQKEQANGMVQQGKYEEAMKLYQTLMIKANMSTNKLDDEEKAELLEIRRACCLNSSMCLLKTGAPESAINAAKLGLELSKTEAHQGKAHLRLAAAYAACKGKSKEAMHHLTKAKNGGVCDAQTFAVLEQQIKENR